MNSEQTVTPATWNRYSNIVRALRTTPDSVSTLQQLKKLNTAPTESLIAKGAITTGSIEFSGGLRIDGEVKGDVSQLDGETGTLVIGLSGCVTGNISADLVVIHGRVKGCIEAEQTAILQSTARVDGDIDYTAIEIHAGAAVQGQLLPKSTPAERDAQQLPAT